MIAVPAPRKPWNEQRWRVGRTLGRTIYAQTGDEPNPYTDTLLALAETRAIAAHIVTLHNQRLAGPL